MKNTGMNYSLAPAVDLHWVASGKGDSLHPEKYSWPLCELCESEMRIVQIELQVSGNHRLHGPHLSGALLHYQCDEHKGFVKQIAYRFFDDIKSDEDEESSNVGC